MKRTLILYETKSESTRDNERLIEAVFRELHAKAPDGVRYMALKLDDGTFVHFSIVDADAQPNPIVALKAFEAFQSGIKERCATPPRARAATVVGSYRMLAE
jgi:hypothetical protein